MGIVLWLIFGALVGWIASLIMKTRRKGLIRNIVIGLIGSFIGGWISSLLGLGSMSAFTIEGFFFAVGGAVFLIWLLRKLKI